MPDKTPPEKPEGWTPPVGRPMSEMEKYWAGEHFNSAKLWQEMDDSGLDSIIAGIRGGEPEAKK